MTRVPTAETRQRRYPHGIPPSAIGKILIALLIAIAPSLAFAQALPDGAKNASGELFATQPWVTNHVATAAVSTVSGEGYTTNTGTAGNPVIALTDSASNSVDNGQTAYGWGDHSTNGYLTSWLAGWGNTNQWNTAYGWGDHSTNDYAVTTAHNTFTASNTFEDVVIFNDGVNPYTATLINGDYAARFDDLGGGYYAEFMSGSQRAHIYQAANQWLKILDGTYTLHADGDVLFKDDLEVTGTIKASGVTNATLAGCTIDGGSNTLQNIPGSALSDDYMTSLSDDTTPQLGGALDADDKQIHSVTSFTATNSPFITRLNTVLAAGYFSDGTRSVKLAEGANYAIDATGDASISGDVGIGTNAPATKLDVNGAATIRGTLDMGGNMLTNASPSSTPYAITLASTVTVSKANGTVQALNAGASNVVIDVSADTTNYVSTLRLELYGSGSVGFVTNRLTGTGDLDLSTTAWNTIMLDSGYGVTNWHATQITRE